MNRLEFMDKFRNNLEIDRTHLGLSQKDFAESIEMSLSAYKRLINGETSKIDVYTTYLLYKLTGKFTHQYVDYTDIITDICDIVRQLNPDQRWLIKSIAEEFERSNNK